MEKRTHKEEMEYLKKYDPILYSELTSDPCGTDCSGDSIGFGIGLTVVFILGVIGGICFFFAA